MKRSTLVAAAALSSLLARPSLAQQAGPSGSLQNFAPVPAGDALFGVPSPSIGGHLVPRAAVIFDFAYKPLSVQIGATRRAIVSHQGFLHASASLALWDRLLLSVDAPFAVVQGGDSPAIGGITLTSPSSAEVGDLRFGARVGIVGGFWDPFQLGVGGYFYAPTAGAGSFAGDGAFRGEPHLLLGGRFTRFVWNVAAGTTLRASAHPHTFNAGAGAALVLGESFFQVGPEITIAVPFTKDASLSTPTAGIELAAATAAEVLLGAKLRPLPPLVIGAGAGPGLTNGWGTPVVRAVGTIGYEPLPPRPAAADTDRDGIPDAVDACPKVPGVRSEDPTKNGCPPDRDRDGIADGEDACPDVAGPRSEDPKKNGCPPDRDGDGVPDASDACPDEPGVASDDPKKHGCPEDTDGDGIPNAKDACPTEAGEPSPDPRKNGCPKVEEPKVEAPKEVLSIKTHVRFLFGKSGIDETAEPVSDALYQEVKALLERRPDIKVIEVQGHTDRVGEAAFNQRLSVKRASSVRAWLIAKGIPAEKLVAAGYGFDVPVTDNKTEEGRQANRRVQFVVVETNGPAQKKPR